jgi:hypothetical protein
MVSVLPSSAVDRGFETRSGQTKNYKISICCFSAMRTALGNKNKDECGILQNHVLLILQLYRVIKITCTFNI